MKVELVGSKHLLCVCVEGGRREDFGEREGVRMGSGVYDKIHQLEGICIYTCSIFFLVD